jgi:hypothetical protein
VLITSEGEQLVKYIEKMAKFNLSLNVGLVKIKIAEITQETAKPFTSEIP